MEIFSLFVILVQGLFALSVTVSFAYLFVFLIAWAIQKAFGVPPNCVHIKHGRLQLVCCDSDEVEDKLEVDRVSRSTVFSIKIMVMGMLWQPRWAFWPDRPLPSWRVLRRNVHFNLKNMLKQSWCCRIHKSIIFEVPFPVGGFANFHPLSQNFQYLIGLSNEIIIFPIIRDSAADHELSHHVQHAARGIFAHADLWTWTKAEFCAYAIGSPLFTLIGLQVLCLAWALVVVPIVRVCLGG